MLEKPVGSSRQFVSLIVPVCNSSSTLGETLASLKQTRLPYGSYEIIVVDDSSDDNSLQIAARYADKIVKLRGARRGPGYARNRGAEVADGELLAFVAPDALVPAETLGALLQYLKVHKHSAAVSASRDSRSTASSFLTNYWTLLVHYGEHAREGLSVDLESDAVVIRRNAFFEVGMYEEWRLAGSCLGGLDLGQRLHRAGHGVAKIQDLGVTTLKKWSVGGMLAEVWRRATLLARSFGYQRTVLTAPGEVVITLGRALTAVSALVVCASALAAFSSRTLVLERGALLAALFTVGNLPLHRFFARSKSVRFALAAIPMHAAVQIVTALALCAGWILRETIGDSLPDATTQALSEVGFESWPPLPKKL